MAILGTGTAYMARKNGKSRAIGGWGFQVGDQGSGARIGRDLLEQTLLAHDGIRQASPLTQAMLAIFRDNPEDVVEFTTTAKPGDFGGFAPMVFDHAAKGDAVANWILGQAVADVEASLGVLDLARQGSALPAGRAGAALRAAPLGALPGAAQAAARRRAWRRGVDGGPMFRQNGGGSAMSEAADQIFATLKQSSQSGAPLYLQLRKSIEDAVNRGLIGPGDALPSERDIATKADISRVTVRKAVQDLVKGGVLVQRHGSGTFVAPRMERVEQSLSQLTSFTEDMARRGMTVRSAWLDRGIYRAVAGRDDGAWPVVQRTGGARLPPAYRRRHAAGDRARRAVGKRAARSGCDRLVALRGAGKDRQPAGAGGAAHFRRQSGRQRCAPARGAAGRRRSAHRTYFLSGDRQGR